MKKIYTVIFAVTMGVSVQAQQDPQYTHFMFDKLSFNPGYAGVNKKICATGIFRQQWSGFDGAPQTALLNIHAPIDILRGGVGLTYFNDQLGFENNNIVRLAYAYHQPIGPGILGIGASAGIVSKAIRATWITPDGTPYTDDLSIRTQEDSQIVPDFGFGLYYTIPNSLYVGLSTSHISESDLGTLNFQTARHYYIVAGYEYAFSDFKLMPNILAKTDAVTAIVDVNLLLMYKNMVWAGATYRLQDAIAPMIGYQHAIKKGMLRIGYSYDITTSELKNYSNGSHEIMLNYCFTIDRQPPITKFKNPRFL